jgi:hypothetical protein
MARPLGDDTTVAPAACATWAVLHTATSNLSGPSPLYEPASHRTCLQLAARGTYPKTASEPAPVLTVAIDHDDLVGGRLQPLQALHAGLQAHQDMVQEQVHHNSIHVTDDSGGGRPAPREFASVSLPHSVPAAVTSAIWQAAPI